MANVWKAMQKSQAEAVVEADTREGADAKRRFDEKPHAHPPAAPVTAEQAVVDGMAVTADFGEALVAHHDRGGAITEEYRALRTSLLAQSPDDRFCYVVTSAEAGEGKTVTCLHLALVLAERTDRLTLVADCDLRKGKVGQLLKADPSPGMADLLRGTATLKDVTQQTPYPNLFCITTGQADHRQVGELIARAELEELIVQLRRKYDYVIIDSPPINHVSDAGMFGRAVGEGLLVVRLGKTRRESADKAVRLLHAANVKLAGMVLTRRRYYIPNYLYRYS